MATPGLEQAVLLVLDIEPLFIFISILFFFVVVVASSFRLLFLSTSFLRVEL